MLALCRHSIRLTLFAFRAANDDAFDVSAEVKSAKQLKHSRHAYSGTPKYSMIKDYLNDPTTVFVALREHTTDDLNKNMLRALAKTLLMDTTWTLDMGDPTLPPTHTSQLRRWIQMDPEPATMATTYKITAVKIAGPSLSEIASNHILPTLPGMPKKDDIWYRDAGIDLLSQLGVNPNNIPASIRMY